MNENTERRGGAAVGFLTELTSIEAASIIYLRLWSEGPQRQAEVCSDLARFLGDAHGLKAMRVFEQLLELCGRHGRRPLMRHAVECRCIGADEACFANFVAIAAEGDREDALLIATLLVRPDVAPLVASLASDFGLALKRMDMKSPRDMAPDGYAGATIH
ncbi:hypothetical protein [uncultured Roseobacter sp.]|uniref:hypothetical protein n=1 Tax=uncultured Roseobacter sp. TaxID=114847 RepID=UPI00260ACEBE|nr:hypothetical protein [uncultured Roseobacter sp.]